MFKHIDVTAKALDATMLRHEVISNNIANSETTGYKRKDVAFEQQLAMEIERNGIENISNKNIQPKIYEDNSAIAYRLDGNTVDIDVEMAELSKTKLKYDTLISRVNSQISRYKYIFQNIK